MLPFSWGYFFTLLVILAILSGILRELLLWYWKVNRIVELLEDIKARLPEPTREGPALIDRRDPVL